MRGRDKKCISIYLYRYGLSDFAFLCNPAFARNAGDPLGAKGFCCRRTPQTTAFARRRLPYPAFPCAPEKAFCAKASGASHFPARSLSIAVSSRFWGASILKTRFPGSYTVGSHTRVFLPLPPSKLRTDLPERVSPGPKQRRGSDTPTGSTVAVGGTADSPRRLSSGGRIFLPGSPNRKARTAPLFRAPAPLLVPQRFDGVEL